MFPNLLDKCIKRNGANIQEAIRILIDTLIPDLKGAQQDRLLSLARLSLIIQKILWANLTKLDNAMVVLSLGELVRAAADGGFAHLTVR